MNNQESITYRLKFIFPVAYYNAIYTLSTVLLSVRSVLGLSQMDNSAFRFLTITAYVLLIIKLIFTPYTKKSFFSLVGMIILTAIISNIAQNTLLIGTVLYIYAAIDIDKMKVLKVSAITIFIMVSIVLLNCLSGNIPVLVNGNVTLGFNNPNVFQQFISIATIILISTNFYSIGVLQLSLFTILNLLTTFISGSSTGLIITIYVFLIAIILKRPNHEQDTINMRIERLALLIIIAILVFVVFYRAIPFSNPLNLLLSGRLMQANHYLNKYGLHLFGAHVIELDSDYEYWHLLLDCGYARLFINYGIIYGIIFILSIYFSLKKYRLNRNTQGIVATMGFVLLLVPENGSLSINSNMALILLSNLLG